MPERASNVIYLDRFRPRPEPAQGAQAAPATPEAPPRGAPDPALAARPISAAEWHAAFVQAGTEFRSMLAGLAMALGGPVGGRVDAGGPPAQHPPRMSAPKTYSTAFWSTLATLPSHGVDGERAGAANALWARLAESSPSEPDILVTDEGAVKFVWFGDRFYFEAAVLPGGLYEWYFRDDQAPPGSSRGTDEPEPSLTEEFWECARLAGGERAGR